MVQTMEAIRCLTAPMTAYWDLQAYHNRQWAARQALWLAGWEAVSGWLMVLLAVGAR